MSTRTLELVGALALGAGALVCAAHAKSWSGGESAPAAARVAPSEPGPPAPARTSPRDWALLERLRVAPPELTSLAERPCPDLTAALRGRPRVLQLTFADKRVEPKQLLPLALTSLLTTQPALVVLEDQLLGGAAPERTRKTLEDLNRYRFRGVYRITDYAEPKLVRKIGKLRPEWLPGVLAASFVVQDLENGRGICQTAPIIVRSDLGSAPISARQRAATRARLTLELGRELRLKTGPALRRITTELELPGDD